MADKDPEKKESSEKEGVSPEFKRILEEVRKRYYKALKALAKK